MQEPNSSPVVVRQQQPPQKRLGQLAGIIAVVATAGGIYLAMANRPHPAKRGAPAGSNYLPENTLAAVNLSTDRQRWQQLGQLGTPSSRAAAAQEFTKWQQAFFTDQGLDFDRDIQPWIAQELTVAYLSSRNVPTANRPVTNLPIVLLPIKQNYNTDRLLDKIAASTSIKPRVLERQYQGITLQEITRPQQKMLATAMIEKFVLVSPSVKAIEQSIDAFKSGKTLTKSPGYPQAWEAIAMPQPLAQIYVNMPWAMAENAHSLTPDKLAQIQQQGLAANINLDGQLLSGKGIAWWPPSSKVGLIPSENSPNFGQRLPENTLMMVSGSDLAQLWADYLPLANNNPAAPVSPLALTTGLKSATGLDLTTDILAWSKNEFSLALLPESQPSSNSLGGSLLLMLKSTDRPAAAATLSKLDQVMASRYQYQVAKTNTKNTDVVNWSSPLGGVGATHGWLADNLAFLALGTPLTDQFLPQPAADLAHNRQFQQVMKSEISPYSGQFFIDLDKLQQSHSAVLPTLTPTAQAILGGVSAIGLTSNATSDVTSRFDLAVLLQQVVGTAP
jgi:hypothetical protein